MKQRPVESLTREHDELEALFENHQHALPAKDIGAACRAINGFRALPEWLIHFGDRAVLQVFVAKKAESPGATLKLFQAEHEKLTFMTDRLAGIANNLGRERRSVFGRAG